jgi:hypothetical protein
MADNEDELFSTAEAAAMIDGDYQDMLEWASEGNVPQVGSAYAWSSDDMDRYEAEVDGDEDLPENPMEDDDPEDSEDSEPEDPEDGDFD